MLLTVLWNGLTLSTVTRPCHPKVSSKLGRVSRVGANLPLVETQTWLAQCLYTLAYLHTRMVAHSTCHNITGTVYGLTKS